MTYQETLDYLYSCLPMYQRIGAPALKPNLNNTIKLCEQLGNPHQSFKSLHIAGTNGKGSSSHMLAAILQSAGYKTGLYTSPHLKNFTERIKIDGREINEGSIVSFVENNKGIIKLLTPSFFEMTVGMAFDYFAKGNVDVAVIEVGLGGRLDSTNIITPEISLITNISADHQDLLGDSLQLIAREKAGIIKPSVPVVIGEYQSELYAVFESKAKECNSNIYFADQVYAVEKLTGDMENGRVNIFKNGELLFSELNIGLGGNYQLMNLPGVLQTIEILQAKGYNIQVGHIREGLARVKPMTGLKGRWQVLSRNPLVVCDAGHNEGGMYQIVNQIASMNYGKLYIIFGVVKDKKLDRILSLLPMEAIYYFCQADIPRALNANELTVQAAHFGLNGEAIPDVNKAINKAKQQAKTNDMIFIGGSSFVVAEINEL